MYIFCQLPLQVFIVLIHYLTLIQLQLVYVLQVALLQRVYVSQLIDLFLILLLTLHQFHPFPHLIQEKLAHHLLILRVKCFIKTKLFLQVFGSILHQLARSQKSNSQLLNDVFVELVIVKVHLYPFLAHLQIQSLIYLLLYLSLLIQYSLKIIITKLAVHYIIILIVWKCESIFLNQMRV